MGDRSQMTGEGASANNAAALLMLSTGNLVRQFLVVQSEERIILSILQEGFPNLFPAALTRQMRPLFVFPISASQLARYLSTRQGRPQRHA